MELVEKVSIVLWCIWFARNKKVWDGKNLSTEIAWSICSKMMIEWQEANKKKLLKNSVQNQLVENEQPRWLPPAPGTCKLNVDASVTNGDISFALGMIVRDDTGRFVAGKNMRIGGKVSVLEAEARGVLEALKWMEVQGYQDVIFECDSELVVHALQEKAQYFSEVGHIFEDCKEKFRQRANFSICHVKKQANRAAHLMAKVPCLLDSFNCFLSPPNLLLEMLASEFSI